MGLKEMAAFCGLWTNSYICTFMIHSVMYYWEVLKNRRWGQFGGRREVTWEDEPCPRFLGGVLPPPPVKRAFCSDTCSRLCSVFLCTMSESNRSRRTRTGTSDSGSVMSSFLLNCLKNGSEQHKTSS